ncbi:MAG: hypothetical protein NT080_05660 [Spirochaetes bacterium]|nr:hypothetical protein [Spirochaetota bacterium]
MAQSNKSVIFPIIAMAIVAALAGTSCKSPLFGLGEKVDTQTPRAKGMTPANGSYVSGSLVIDGTWSDDIGVAAVSLQITDPASGAVLDEVTTTVDKAGTWASAPIDTTAFADGQKLVIATLQDARGNETQDRLLLYFDNKPPAVVIENPSVLGIGASYNGSVLISGQSYDDISPIATVTVSVYSAADAPIDGSDTPVAQGSSDSVPGWSFSFDGSALPAGGYIVVVEARDAAGNVNDHAFAYNDLFTANSGVLLTIDKVIRIDRGTADAAVPDVQPAEMATLRIQNAMGLRTAAPADRRLYMDPDSDKPTFDIASPDNNGVIGPSSVANGLAYDDDINLSTLVVEYQVRRSDQAFDGSWTGAVASGSGSTFKWRFNLPSSASAAPDKRYMMKVRAADNGGAVGESAVVYFTVDTGVPTVSVDPLAYLYYNDSETITVSGSATSNAGRIDELEIKVDGKAWETVAIVPAETVAWSHPLPLATVAEGAASISVRAKDYSLDAEESVDDKIGQSDVLLILDNTHPSATLLSPSPGTIVYRDISLQGSSGDNNSVTKLEIAIGSGGFGDIAGNIFSWTQAIADANIYANGTDGTLQGDGSYQVQVRLRTTDIARNTTTNTANIYVKPSLDEPAAVIYSPAAAATVSGAVTIGGSSSDERPGVKEVRVRLVATEGAVAGGADIGPINLDDPTISPVGSGWKTIATTASWSVALAEHANYYDVNNLALYAAAANHLGWYRIEVQAYDNQASSLAGQVVTRNFRLFLDANAPKVTVAQPATLYYKDGATVNLSGTATAPALAGHSLSRIEYMITPKSPDAETWVTIAVDSEWTASATLPAYAISEGGAKTIKVRAWAKNASGDESTPAEAETFVIVDTHTPVLSFIAPASAGLTVNGLVQVKGSTTDNSGDTSMLDKVWVKLNVPPTTGDTALVGMTYSWDTTVDTTGLSGIQTIYILATDKAGNERTASITVNADQASDKPSVSVADLASSQTVGALYRLVGTASDDDGLADVNDDGTTDNDAIQVQVDALGWIDVTSKSGPATQLSWDHSLPALSEGAHTLHVRVRDDNSTSGSYPVTAPGVNWWTALAGIPFVVDTNIPSVDISKLAPGNNGYVSGDFTLAGSSGALIDNNGIASATFHVNGVPHGTTTTLTGTAPNFAFTKAIQAAWLTGSGGVNTIRIVAEDTSVPAKQGESTIQVIYDTADPTITILTPSVATTLNGTVSVQGIASDEKYLSWVKLYFGGTPDDTDPAGYPGVDFWSTTGTITGSKFAYTVSGVDTTVWTGTLTIKARDGAGHITTSVFNYTTDQDADKPVISITAPTNGDKLGLPVRVNGLITEDDGVHANADAVQIRVVTGSDWATGTQVINWTNVDTHGTGVNATFSHSLLGTVLTSDGAYTFRMRAYDVNSVVSDYGNPAEKGWNESASVSFTLDSSAPSISNVEPVNNGYASGVFTAKATVTDANGVASVLVRHGVTDYPMTFNAGSGKYEGQVGTVGSPIPNGSQSIDIIATDTTGKSSTVGVQVVIDDDDPNAIQWVTPAANAFVNGTFTIAGRASDPTSPIATVTAQIVKSGTPLTVTGTSYWEILNFISSTYECTTYGELVPDEYGVVDQAVRIEISVTATDAAGKSTAGSLFLRLDQESDRPLVRISNLVTDPASGSYPTTLKLTNTIYGTVSDDDGVSKIEASLDNLSWEELVINGGGWSYDAPGDDGTKTLYLKVTDANSGVFTSTVRVIKTLTPSVTVTTTPVTFKIDTFSPEIDDLVEVNAGSGWTNLSSSYKFGGASTGSFNIRAKTKDANGIFSVTADIKGKDKASPLVDKTVSATLGSPTGPDGSGFYTYTSTTALDVTGLVDNNLSLTITVEDNSLLKGIKTKSVVVDNTVPTLTFFDPANNATVNGDVTVKGFAGDNLAGLASVSYKIGWNGAASWTAATGSLISWEIPFLTSGTGKIDLYAGVAVTAIPATDIFTRTAHGFTEDQTLRFGAEVLLPTGISSATVYYVKYVDANSFQVTAAPADIVAVDFTTSGTAVLASVYSSDANNDGIWDFPIQVRVADEAGNETISAMNAVAGTSAYLLKLNPGGDKPIVTLSYPDDPLKPLGGTVRVSGFTVDNNAVWKVFMQVDVDNSGTYTAADIASNLVDWYALGLGREVTGTNNWYQNINADGEFNPPPGENRSINIRIRAQDTKNMLAGDIYGPWVETSIIFDNDVPKIGTTMPLLLDRDPGAAPATVTAGNVANSFARTAHGLGTDNQVYFSGTLPAGLVAGTAYHVVNPNANDFQVSLTHLGPVVDITDDGSSLTFVSVDGDELPYTLGAFITGDWYLRGSVEDETQINGIAFTGDLSGNLSTQPAWFQQAGVKVYFLDVPIDTDPGTSDSLIWTLTATDNTTPTPRESIQVMRIEVDNKAPTATWDGDPDDSDVTPNDLIVQNNGWFQIRGTALDDGSDVKQVAVYLVRRSGTARFFNPRELKGAPGNTSDLTPADTLTTSDGSVVDYPSDPDFLIMIDHKNVVESRNAGGGIDNDDTDNYLEKLKKFSGDTYEWYADIDSSNVADGPIEVHYVVFDMANNTKHCMATTKVQNNGPKVGAVNLGTDLDLNGTVETGEYVRYVYPGVATGITTTFTAKEAPTEILLEVTGGNGELFARVSAPKTSGGTFTSAWFSIRSDEASPITSITLSQADLTDIGDGTKTFTVDVWDSTEGTTPKVDSLNQTKTAVFTTSTTDTVDPSADIDPFYWTSELVNSLYDNSRTNGHIELTGVAAYGAGDPDVSGKVSIRGTAYDNWIISKVWLYIGNGADNADNFGFAATPALTTKDFGGLTYALVGTFASGGYAETGDFATDGWHFSVPSSVFTQGNHRIAWQLDWNSARLGSITAQDRVARIVVEDKDDGTINSSLTTQALGTPVTGTGATRSTSYVLQHDALKNSTAIVPGLNITLTLSGGGSPTTTLIRGFDPVAGSIELDAAVDPLKTSYSIAFPDNMPSYQFDVVPYITGITRDATYNTIRSRQGRYSLRRGENATITGFNLFDSVADTISFGTVPTTLPADATTSSFVVVVPAGARSGEVLLTVNGINSINNLDDDTLAGNKEYFAVTPGSELWTDTRMVHIWQSNSTATGADMGYFVGSSAPKYPAMSYNGGNLYASWSNYSDAATYYSTNNTGVTASAVEVYSSYDPLEHTDISYGGRPTVAFNANTYGNNTWDEAGAGGVMIWDANAPLGVNDGGTGRAYAMEELWHDQMLMQFVNERVVNYGTDIHTSYYDTDTKALKYAWVQNGDTSVNEHANWVNIDGGSDADDAQLTGTANVTATATITPVTYASTLTATNVLATITSNTDSTGLAAVGTHLLTATGNLNRIMRQANTTWLTYNNAVLMWIAPAATNMTSGVTLMAQVQPDTIVASIQKPVGSAVATNDIILTMANLETVLAPYDGFVATAAAVGTTAVHNSTQAATVSSRRIATVSKIVGATVTAGETLMTLSDATAVTAPSDGTIQSILAANTVLTAATTTVATLTTRSAAAGEYSAIDVTPTNHFPVIAYYDVTNQTVKLAYANATAPVTGAQWKVQTVMGSTDVNRKFSGKYISMRIDGSGYVHLAFYRNSTGDLIYMKSTNHPIDGSMKYEFGDSVIVDSIGAVGVWADITLAGNVPYISYLDSSYTNTFDAVKMAYYDSTLDSEADGEPDTVNGWEYMNAALDFEVDGVRTSIENDTGGARFWQAAIGYASSDFYRIGYYVK